MIEMKKITILLFILVLVAACSDEQQKHKNELMKQVMAAHDEVMPKMGDLRKTAKALQARADSLSTLTDQDYTPRVAELRQAAQKIEQANEGMMGWMRQFEVPDNEAPVAEVITYLKDQKAKVNKVRDEMLRSLEEGQALE